MYGSDEDMRARADKWRRQVEQISEEHWRPRVVQQAARRQFDREAHGLAVASVLIGLISLIVWPLGMLGFSCGWRATARGRNQSGGDTALAITGMMLGLVTSVLSVGVLVVVLVAAAR